MMLSVGIKGRIEKTVTTELTARVMGSGSLDVFATPAMIALIEETAWRSVQEKLDEGQGTVGTRLEIDHLSATPVGMKVWCETELKEIDKRKLVFAAEVYDETGKIGAGTHERFIVENAKFQAKADSKIQVDR